VLLIAHRGSSSRAPENSLAAFAAALEDGADGVEFDVRLTADGHPVVAHDDDLARTTGASGRISELRLDHVRAFRAAGRPIPTLEETLGALAGRTRLVVELKADLGHGGFRSAEPVARAAAPLLLKVPSLTVSSFDPAGVSAIRELLPGVATALIGARIFDPMLVLGGAMAGGHGECHIDRNRVTAEFVASAHHAGKRVMAWTVDDPARAAELRGWGVDGVFTDDPAGLRAALA
jgi:glycerophosphoryl diester phosphodiesterase